MRTRRTWCQTAPVSARVTSANFYLPFPPPLKKPFVDYRAILAQNKCMNIELCIVSHGTLRNIAHSRQTVVLLVVIWNNGSHSGGRQMRLTRACCVQRHVKEGRLFVAKRHSSQELRRLTELVTARFQHVSTAVICFNIVLKSLTSILQIFPGTEMARSRDVLSAL